MAAAVACSVPSISSSGRVNCSRGFRQENLHGHHRMLRQARGGCFNALLGDSGPAKVEHDSHCGLTFGLESAVAGNREKVRRDWAAARQQQQQSRREDSNRELRAPSKSTKWWNNYCNSARDETYPDVTSASSICKPALDSRLSSQNHLHAHQFERLKFWIITANTSDELLAAATLRAQSFSSYPKCTSTSTDGLHGIKARLKHEFDMRDLMKSRVKSEFESDSKMQNLNMNVKCLLAVCEESNHEELLLSSQEERNSLIAPPAVAAPAFSRTTSVAIGTLDIQDGTGSTAAVDVNTVIFQLFSVAKLKKKHANRRQISESGQGPTLLSLSSNAKSQVNHGYIFNLCVTQTVQRHGVATALMKEAVQVAQQMQLQILYVHVEVDNIPALALYQKLGYIIEEEEPFDVESRFRRPRRILLSYRFQ